MAKTTVSLFKLNYLGDAVTFLPTVQGIRRLLPDAAVSVICSRATAGIFTHTFPDANVIGLDRQRVNGIRGLSNLPRLLWHLGIGRCDYALLSHDEPSLSHLAAICSLSKKRIGFELTSGLFRRTLAKALPIEEGRNVVDLNFDIVRHLTGDNSLNPERTPIGYTKEDVAVVTRKLWDVGIEDGAAFVLFHPFAKRKYQQWSLQKYKDLSRQIFESGKKTIFLSEKNGRDISDVASVCDITLPQLSVLCEKAKLFIGNNSGPLHVAAAMGTATLAVQGPTSPEWNVYWTDAPHRRVTATSVPCIPCEKFGQVFWDCINDEQPMACMEAVSVEEVYRAAMDLLS